MGQFMEALNNQTVLDDLGLNIDTFQGELPNVDEVSKDVDDMISAFSKL